MQWLRWRLALAAAGVVLACEVLDQAFAGCYRSRLRNAGVVGGAVSLRGVAPWLREPRSLDEARGVKRPKEASGGYHRANHAAKFKQKKVEPTALDRIADTLASSRTRLFAKAPLQHSRKWPKADPAYAEVAVIGRSNVGKSSLLNKISQFGTVARVSSMPGQTKEAAWYRNKKVKVDFIDMPGYGHSARARVFGPEALSFVRNRTSLRGLYVLIDARHGFKWSDHEWLSELGSAGPMKQVVLTKCDLVPDKKLIEVASLVRSDLESYKRVERKVILCSSAWLTGFRDLRKDICERCKLLKGTTAAPKPGARRDDLPLRATKGQDLGIL
ncbi:putative GTP-binding protein EngB [Symbiodinium microadriaticum]|uniref:Putative GTP-binding protein EngB n=1 Tax=Symbiodinium microadriaticum TaxID=2951 RepID=A0A1Q9CGK5_SYMMI|nr:putative GTP-binding protein EngB [Symbiodinium microadriaticum]